MPEKNEFQTLVEEATGSGLPLSKLRGVAFYDMEKDIQLISLNSFARAEQAITQIPHFVTRLGASNARRVALQFLYEYFDRVKDVRHDEAVFKALSEDLIAEINNPQWVTRGVANVRKFYQREP